MRIIGKDKMLLFKKSFTLLPFALLKRLYFTEIHTQEVYMQWNLRKIGLAIAVSMLIACFTHADINDSRLNIHRSSMTTNTENYMYIEKGLNANGMITPMRCL